MMSRAAFYILFFLGILTSTLTHRSRRLPSAIKKSAGLNLPVNATSIRENIVDTFSCESRIYGYYADIDNECQIFHVCVPRIRNSIRYSFICPRETIFNQATFVCTRTGSSIPCEESEKYYKMNEAFGKVDGTTVQQITDSPVSKAETMTDPVYPTDIIQRPTRPPFTSEPTHNPSKPPITTFPTQRPLRPQTTTYPSQRPTRPQASTGSPGSSTSYAQRPSRPPTFQTNIPDYYPSIGFTQRPPRPNQSDWRRQ